MFLCQLWGQLDYYLRKQVHWAFDPLVGRKLSLGTFCSSVILIFFDGYFVILTFCCCLTIKINVFKYAVRRYNRSFLSNYSITKIIKRRIVIWYFVGGIKVERTFSVWHFLHILYRLNDIVGGSEPLLRRRIAATASLRPSLIYIDSSSFKNTVCCQVPCFNRAPFKLSDFVRLWHFRFKSILSV